MSAQDQLEIINAQGDVRFYSLNTGAGITNIGRHPDNDIVIESPEVAPFHAVLDHQQKPYRIVALSSESRIKVSGQILQPNAPRELHNWDTIELDGYSLILLESGAAVPGAAPSIAPSPASLPAILPVEPVPAAASFGAAATVPSPGAPIEIHDLDELDRLLASIPEDRVDDLIMVEPTAQMNAMDPAHPNALDFSVEVDQSATLQVTIVNGGDLVSEFLVEVRGVDPGWVAILPRSINLNDGDRGAVSIAITPPRLSSTRAKAHYFAIVVTSPSYPGRMSSTTGMLVVRPFYEYAVGDIDPKKLKVSWSKRVGQAAIPIANRGNSDAPFQLSGEDDHHAANIEFDSPEEGLKLEGQIQFHVPPEQTIAIPIFITPRKRPIVGVGGQDINYTVSVTPLAGETQTPRTVLGQARSLPLIGPLPIVLLVILFALLVILIFRPWIAEFKPDVKEIESGQSVTLSWRASPLASLRIDPDVGKVEGPEGSVALSPLDDVTYTLKAETFLTRLLPQWFTAAADVRIVVDPVLPKVEFRVDRDSILSSEKVVLSWEVQAQQPAQVILTVNGAPETILPDEYIGSRPFVLERDTTFTLKVSNRYTPPEGQTASLVVKVTVPSPTPRPLPVIERFDVTPLEITAGESVTVSWAVSGTDKVKIEGIGELPPSGSISAKPAASIAYVLTASNGQQEVSSLVKQVIVNPAPTPTPLPGTPRIEFFTASPSEVAIGSPESKSITLSWSVIGDVTNVEVSGPTIGKFTGLPSRGSLKISADKQTLVILTAFNGKLSASQTVQIKVKNPVPKINSISPSTSTNVGGPGFTLIITGTGFVKDSKVRWDGSNRATGFVSETQLTAAILPDDIVKAGTFNVSVFNSTPGGGASGAAVFTLNNPVPDISSITPASVTKGSTGITLTVNGSNFVDGSKVRFGGVDMATTFVNSGQLTAIIPAGQLANAGTPIVTVFNPTPGGGLSDTATFTINDSNPRPTISDIFPTSGIVGAITTTIAVTGTNFIDGSLVRANSTYLPTTYGSDTSLTADIPPLSLSTAGTRNITVFTDAPGGGITATAAPFTLSYPTVTVASSGGSTVLVGSTLPMTANISGGPQAQQRTISLSNSSSAIRFTNCAASVITQTVTTAPDYTSASFCVEGLSQGSATATTVLPSILGGDADSIGVTVNNPTPSISNLNPSNFPVNGGSFTLVVTGSNFVNGAVVQWPSQPDLAPLAGNFTSTAITVTVPGSYVSIAGAPDLSVRNPTPCNVLCDSNTLPFNVQRPLAVTVSLVGGASGSVSSAPAGVNCSSGVCTGYFNDASSVTLTATPGANTAFTGWTVTSGTCTGTTSPCQVTMSASRSVTATFTRQYTLTVTKSGAGTGTVTSTSPASPTINCGSTCSQNFNVGATVTLNAAAGVDSAFSGWSGCTPGAGNTCTITMNSNATVDATFGQQFNLTVTISTVGDAGPGGDVTGGGIDCPSTTCSVPVSGGGNVVLTALPRTSPGSGYEFTSWSGCDLTDVGPPATCTVQMSVARTVTATFTRRWNLSVTVSEVGGGADGRVNVNPPNTNCDSGTCTYTGANAYTNGATVTLTATAQNGNTSFMGWTVSGGPAGTCTGTTTPCALTMNANMTVTAEFRRIWTLSVTVSEVGSGAAGTVTSNIGGINCTASPPACTATFTHGAVVQLTAAAGANTAFANGWTVGSGGCTGTTTPCNVTMNSDVSVTAEFRRLWTLAVSRTNVGTGAGGTVTSTSNPSQTNINCGATCSVTYTHGTTVNVSASPNGVSEFSGWSGDCAGATCSLTMDGDKTITATFTRLWTLTVTLTENGSSNGTVNVSPPNVNCTNGTCTYTNAYTDGQSVTLTASASSGSFGGYSGGGCGAPNPCTVMMNSAITVTATFTPP